MEIIGTGLDATEIDRIAAAIERYGDRFIQRVFTEHEIAYCRAKRDFASSFAARFAAKEAAMKALGTGHSRGVFWTGIEVFRRTGPPQLRFHGGAAGTEIHSQFLVDSPLHCDRKIDTDAAVHRSRFKMR